MLIFIHTYMHTTVSIVPNFLMVVAVLFLTKYFFLFVVNIQQLFVYSYLGHKADSIKATSLSHRWFISGIFIKWP